MATKKRITEHGRVGRFFYIGSKRGKVLHLSRHITECYRTLCGVMIPPPGQWFWAKTRTAKRYAKRAPICKKCLRVAPQIIVSRVRKS